MHFELIILSIKNSFCWNFTSHGPLCSIVLGSHFTFSRHYLANRSVDRMAVAHYSSDYNWRLFYGYSSIHWATVNRQSVSQEGSLSVHFSSFEFFRFDLFAFVCNFKSCLLMKIFYFSLFLLLFCFICLLLLLLGTTTHKNVTVDSRPSTDHSSNVVCRPLK